MCRTASLGWYGNAPSSSCSRSLGVGEHRQRLVGVGGEHDLVEALGRRAARRDRHVVGVAMDRAATGVDEPQPVAATARISAST